MTEAELADHWFSMQHSLLEQLQRAYREDGKSTTDIGRQIGKSSDFVFGHVTGRRKSSMRTLHDLARAMGYRVRVTMEKS